MSQHDYIIANDTGANVRADLNDVLAAIVSNNSGATAPSSTYAFQFWYDTTNSVLKVRNSGNDAWVELPFDFSTDGAKFGDNVKAQFGDSNDLQIYHDGSNSYIQDTGTGNLFIQGESAVYIRDNAGAAMAVFNDGGAVQLRYNGSEKLATTSTGIDVTGTVTADELTVDSGVARLTSSHIAFSGNVSTPSEGAAIFRPAADTVAISTNNSERMRIDSSGNLLVGKTSPNIATVGAEFRANGIVSGTRSSDPAGYFNRTTSGGDIVEFRKDNTTVGSINVATDFCGIHGTVSGSCGIGFYSNYTVRPLASTGSASDNLVDLGHSSNRWDDVYATNGTIQTSDRNEKQDIEAISEAEQRVAVACKGLMRKFRWQDAVAEKGDDARIHFGIIAQDLQDAFAAEGLDAGKYAMFISSTWWETQTEVPAVEAVDAVYETVVIPAEYDEEGNEITPETTEERLVSEAVEAKEAYTRTDTYDSAEEAPEGAVERTRLGVRYPELLAFIIAAI
jgi:hypothetical protein